MPLSKLLLSSWLVFLLLAAPTCFYPLHGFADDKPQKAPAENADENPKFAGQAALDEATKLRVAAERFQDLGRVVELCEEALRKGLDPENRVFAEQLLLGTRLERAEQICQQIFERQPPHEKWPELARAALIDLELAVRGDEKLAEAHYWLGRIHALPGGNRRRAIAAFDKAIQHAGDNRSLKARAHTFRGDSRTDPESKLADYNTALELLPEFVGALRARGLLHMQMNKHDKALEDFRQAIKLEPAHARTHEALAVELLLNKDLEGAKESLDRAIELSPDSSTAYAHRARIFAMEEKFEEALADINKAIETAPDNMLWRMLRAEIYQKLEKPEEALADVDEVLEKEPRLLEAIRTRAALLASLDRMDEALADLKFAAQEFPTNPDVHMSLAMVYLAQKQPRKAIEELNEVLGLDVQHWSVYRRRADALLSIGKQAEAIIDYEKTLELEPNDSSTLNNLAWVLATSPNENLRDGKRSIELAEKAAELTEHKQAYILSTLAASYAENGDFETAVKWSKKALKLGEHDLKEQLTAELESYKAGKPWRELQNVEEGDEKKEDKPEKTANLPPSI